MATKNKTKTKRAPKPKLPKLRSKTKSTSVRELELQEKALDELASWKALAERFIDPGIDAAQRIACSLPDINLRLALIEKLMWPRALLILRDDKGARCHRVNMPPDGKGLSQAFTFRSRHVGPQVLELQQLGAIPLIMLTVAVGGMLVVDGGAIAAHIEVPIEGIDITAVVSVLA